MASRWFYKVFDQEMGPVGFQDLAEMVRTGTLTEDDRVRREFSEEWTPAREVIGLFRAAHASAAETKPPAPSAPQRQPQLPEAPVVPTPRPRRWRLPRVGTGVWIAAAIVLAVSAMVGYEVWSHRHSRVFPESALKKPRQADKLTLESLRASRPKEPSVPGLKENVATPIPGLEDLDPCYSPCLSPDLKTIVFARVVDWRMGYDLYIATRDDVSKPFGPPKLIRSCQSPETDAYVTLSPDGLELIFARSDRRPQLLHAMRETADGEFGVPVLWKIPDYHPEKKQRVERPQFLDALHVMFCFIDMESNTRKMLVARRPQPKEALGHIQPMPFSNGWPRWFVSANGLRAYYGGEEGLFVAAREHADEAFGEPIKLLETKLSGAFDGPIWVAPHEDVVFYVSSGPGNKPGPGRGDRGRKLWMIRF